MTKYTFKLIAVLLILSLNLLLSCKNEDSIAANSTSNKYSTLETKILLDNKPIQLIGTNSFHVFSPESADMNSWNIDLSREFIGNIKETPITGNVIQDSNSSYLHSIQSIVDSNRANNRITIICPFGWDGKESNMFTGKFPTQTIWWNDYKVIMQQWATYFKNQPDVWIEVWNEPFRYDRTDGYTDAIWFNTMNEIVTLIRNTGNTNMILVPCAEQGQDESVLLNKGTEFLKNKSNILFDIHAYEKWLLDENPSLNNRLDQLIQKKLPIIFGETAPINAGVLMNPKSFLDLIYNRGLSVCAWTWKKDTNDQDALLNNEGLPNNNNNNNWGDLYKTISSKKRNP
jgi:mannan endo-1,4-beta-mannosidase